MAVEVTVPEGLAPLAPGPELAARLAGVDPATVPNDEVLALLQAQSRQLAHEQARMFAVISEVAHRQPWAAPGQVQRGPDPAPYCVDEIRAALAWTMRAADKETDLALSLVCDLPLVQVALEKGWIDRGKAAVFARYLVELTPAQIDRICRKVLPRAGRRTPGQIAAELLRLIIEIDPAYQERRYRKAVRDRAVCGYLNPDGTATLTASGLRPEEATAAVERVDALARAARATGSPATLDQLRADVVIGLLDGSWVGMTRDQIIDALLRRDSDPDAVHPVHDGNARPQQEVPHDRAASGYPSVGHDAGQNNPGDDDSREDDSQEDRPGDNRTENENPDDGDPDDGDPDDNGPDDNGPDDGGPDNGGPDTGPGGDDPGSGGPVPGTEIRVGLATLLGADTAPGEIPGWGPVPACAARTAVARQRRAEWRWAVVDAEGHLLSEGLTRRRPHHLPVTGPARGGIVELHVPESLLQQLATAPHRHPEWADVIADIAVGHAARDRHLRDLDADPRRRFPRAGLRRHTQIRDRCCRHPGCRAPARTCEQDHTIDHHDGGTTTADDLSPACGHHHALKTRGGWSLEQPRPGHFIWRSPLGGCYPVALEPIQPPGIEPVVRAPDPWHDEPARDSDLPLTLHPRGRPPPRPHPEPPPSVNDLREHEDPPF